MTMMTRRVAVALFSMLVLSGCGLSSANDPCRVSTGAVFRGIRNGDAGDRCSYGYVVEVDINAQHFDALCTGVLVSKNAVLTAAHCFLDPALGTIESAKVTTSALTRETVSGVAYRTIPTFSFSDYDSPDLALVYLESDLSQTPVTRAAANASIGTAVTALGYGLNASGIDGNGTSGVFLEGALLLIDGNAPSIGCGVSKNICAYGGGGAKNQETCEGDSGGPLLNGSQLIGILSGGNYLSGDATCRGAVNSIYTSVIDQSAWIDAQLAAGSAGATTLTH